MIHYFTDEALALLEGNEYIEPIVRLQAAAEIRALRAENERMEKALRQPGQYHRAAS
jgi:hypothetical protein